MATLLKPDVCVIGAGSGGLTVAAAVAAFGVPVVLIERGRMGGDCLNYGCVPSKSMLAAAKQAQRVSHSARFGVANVDPQVDFDQVMQHVRDVIASIAPHDSVERFTELGVKVIQEEAHFRDAGTVVAGDYEIRARRFVIATGSSPMVPPIAGLETTPYFTNETIFERTEKPEHLVVIGGGPIGLELAQAHRRLGARVSVVEAQTALGKDDPELASVVVETLREEGVKILENAKVQRVESHGTSGVRIHVERDGKPLTIEGSHLLVATGRRANVGALALERAGIDFDPSGIKVSNKLRTTNRRVYAIGDVVSGGLQFTHVANYHAGLVVRALLFRLPAMEKRDIIPWVTYTDPELAHIGLTEADARKQGMAVTVLRSPLAENDRARAERATAGFIKLVVGRGGRILGASIVGSEAGELISFWSLAISRRMKIQDIAAYVAPYPTRSEIGKRAAIGYFSGMAAKPAVHGLIRFLRLFG
ncbi:dihydrolipoyl dehydrogenase family protein [Chelativorans sp. YIM 93263]|uniref:dihydrolipoyl dehydrogenase family protein n=1 Tax=Chelativorans sp. YIM 93263 TaxID=2906648 RepID=UPI002379FF4F|nr:FAD-dependent oxidoreductase [Chelativorans sp. YIM 93263]